MDSSYTILGRCLEDPTWKAIIMNLNVSKSFRDIIYYIISETMHVPAINQSDCSINFVVANSL